MHSMEITSVSIHQQLSYIFGSNLSLSKLVVNFTLVSREKLIYAQLYLCICILLIMLFGFKFTIHFPCSRSSSQSGDKDCCL